MKPVATSRVLNALAGLIPPSSTWINNGAQAAGVSADLVATIDVVELGRRRDASVAALPGSLRLLDDLLTLPLCVPVHTCALPAASVARMVDAPAGCVRVDADHVTRLLAIPLEPVAAVCSSTSWRAAMSTALAIAPMAPVYIHLPGQRELHEDLWEAQLSGVGVLADVGDDVVAVLPAAAQDAPMKPARWRFAERALAAVLNSAPPATPGPRRRC